MERQRARRERVFPAVSRKFLNSTTDTALQTYTLFDLNEHIRRVMALNFPQPLWLSAEIGQANPSRGHVFFDLVQKGDFEVVAQAQAVLWQKDLARLRAAHGQAADEVLREGLQVRLQVRVDFSERYGLKLVVADLDPAFTFGQLELERRATIQALQQTGLLRRNAALLLPRVLQRVAVITSETAAGYQDFREHLAQNQHGYRFDLQVFASAMQGKKVEAELPAALARVGEKYQQFDCAVVLRGGGTRLDLAAFDGLEVCKSVAYAPIPVLTGIGHDVDETVLDLVAHTALKTPTAVADFLVQHNFEFENQLRLLGAGVRQLAQNLLKTSDLAIANMEQNLRWSARERLRSAGWHLAQAEQSLPVLARQTLRNAASRLAEADALCRAFDPATMLRRGYSLTLKNGKTVRSTDELRPGDALEIVLADGRVRSTVE